jgi:hypothetical protein
MFETTNQPIIDPKKYAAVVEWNQFPHVFFETPSFGHSVARLSPPILWK